MRFRISQIDNDTLKTEDHSWLKHLPSFLQKRLQGRQELQKAVGNTGWLFADKILRMGVGLLVGVWIARYLGPVQFGLLSFAGSLIALFNSFATLGLESIVVRDIVEDPGKENETVGTTFLLRFVAALFSYLVLYATILVLRPNDPVSHSLVGILGLILIFNAFDTIDLWFQSRVLSKYVVLAKNVAFLISAAARIYLVLTKAPLIAFAIVNTAEIGLGAVGLLVVYYRNGQWVSKWAASLERARTLLVNCWPIILSSVVSMICLRVDQVMLGQLVGPKEVGIYAAAVRVAEVWYFIPIGIVTSVFPNIVRAKSVDEVEFHVRVQKLYNLLAFIGYAIAVPTTFVSGFVVKLLFGAEYAAAAPMLVILVWSSVFINLSIAKGSYLMAMNWPRVLLFTSVLCALANIGLNLLLIPRYGGVGAAVASLVSYWFGAHGTCYFYRPLHPTARMLLKALVAPKFWV